MAEEKVTMDVRNDGVPLIRSSNPTVNVHAIQSKLIVITYYSNLNILKLSEQIFNLQSFYKLLFPFHKTSLNMNCLLSYYSLEFVNQIPK